MQAAVDTCYGSTGPRREKLLLHTTTAGRIQDGPYKQKLEQVEASLEQEMNYPLGEPHRTDEDVWTAFLLQLDKPEITDDLTKLDNPELFKKADEKAGKGLASAMMRSIASPFSTLSNYYDSSVSNESLFQVQTDIILKKAAAESCIIVGRCGDYILRNHPQHLRIFIRADYDDRVKFVCEHDGVTPAKARQTIDKTDNQRSEYHNFYSETNWGDSRAYDICINSSLLGLEGTAEFLLNFARKYLKIQ
jgi:cytidylate kinase